MFDLGAIFDMSTAMDFGSPAFFFWYVIMPAILLFSVSDNKGKAISSLFGGTDEARNARNVEGEI